MRRMSARVSPPGEQVHLPWTHVFGEPMIIHNDLCQEDTTDEDDEDEKVTVTDKVDEDEGDDNHNKKPKLQNCQHCDNYVSHFRASNGIPGSFSQAETELYDWLHEEFPGVEELGAELFAKSSEAERLRIELSDTETTLDAKNQQIAALLEENRRLKASREEGYLQLRNGLLDEQKRRKVLSGRNTELQTRLGLCRQLLVNTQLELKNTRDTLP